jgi:hypothetical protein
VASGPNWCGQPAPGARHEIIVVGDAFLFPLKTQMTTVRPEFFTGSHCYYLQLNPVAGATWDQIGQLLKPIHPTKLQFSNPMQFRKILAQLVSDFQTESKDSKNSPLIQLVACICSGEKRASSVSTTCCLPLHFRPKAPVLPSQIDHSASCAPGCPSKVE